ncbi:MAG: TRAP transporter large permease subunit, partial [Rhizobacter sp.]
RHVLHDTMTLTGLLLALLMAATTFSLVLRGFGTDVLISQALGRMSGNPMGLMLAVLAGLVACSFVLDAFEMIFLVIPLVMPPLLMALPDPAWVAAVTLLVLQAGFLLPPFGYAVLMSRALMPGTVSLRALVRALWPQLVVQAVVVAAVLVFPQVTRWARPAEAAVAGAADADQTERLMQQAIEAQQGARETDKAQDDAASAVKR